MADRRLILIVEDDEIHSMDLADAVEERGANVLGPVATVAEALQLLDRNPVDGAVLDANLLDRNVTPVALRLIDLAVPFLIHTGIGLPDELAAAFPHVSVIMKPASSTAVVKQLLDQIEDHHRHLSVDPLTSENGQSHSDLAQAEQVERIASAFHGQFGDMASVIVRRQAVGSTGNVLRSWSAIMARLEQLKAG